MRPREPREFPQQQQHASLFVGTSSSSSIYVFVFFFFFSFGLVASLVTRFVRTKKVRTVRCYGIFRYEGALQGFVRKLSREGSWGSRKIVWGRRENKFLRRGVSAAPGAPRVPQQQQHTSLFVGTSSFFYIFFAFSLSFVILFVFLVNSLRPD